MAIENDTIPPSRPPTGRRYVWIALAGLALGVSAAIYFRPADPVFDHPLEGKEAPPLVFELEPGKTTSVSEYKGKALFLNFWAIWCQPCLEEMPSLVMLEQHFKDKGLVMLAFNVEEDSEDIKLQMSGLEMPTNVILNFNKKFLEPYDVRAIPVSVLIDRTGIIRRVYEGPRDWMDSQILHEIADVLK